MTIEMTLGIGGDVVNLNAFWNYLKSVDPLSDDFLFYQISSTLDTVYSGGAVDFNNKTVSIICPFNNCHQGSFNQGYVCELNNVTIQFRSNNGFMIRLDDIIHLENMRFKKLDNINLNMLYCGSYNIPGGMTIRIKNCLLEGTWWGHSRGIRGVITTDAWYISDSKIYNFGQGIAPLFNGISGTSKVIENCAIDMCGEGLSLDNAGWYVRDTYSIRAQGGGVAYGGCGANDVFTNCADDDGSLLTCGGTLINCLPPPPITPVNEFQSLNIADANYLKLIDGTRRWI